MIKDSVADFAQKNILPNRMIWDEAQIFPRELFSEMGKIGLMGMLVPEEYGGAGLDQISYGLIMQEIERGDSGVRSTASVQSSLVMYPIWKYGNEEQRMKYLPKLASGEFIGCFGLTEPDFGSNPGGMVANFKDG